MSCTMTLSAPSLLDVLFSVFHDLSSIAKTFFAVVEGDDDDDDDDKTATIDVDLGDDAGGTYTAPVLE